ncbi:MAG: LamG domain-containing protein, partial [Flavobacteriaceae bacterium]|nr:LamG domain-containing protein [Flavobacteriaceae bacterium]
TVTYTTPEIIQDGLVLYLDTENPNSYPGSGNTWYDLSGNDNDLTLYGDPLFNGEINGGVINFDETNDYAQTNSTSVLNRTTYTKIAIFYPRSATKNIISGSEGSSRHAFWMNGSSNSIRAGHSGSWSQVIYSPGNMLNSWHYSAVTFSNTDGFELYYNGTSVGSNSGVTTLPDGNGLIRVGAYSQGGGDTPGNFFDGYIPVVLVYDRVLNADEIKVNYNYFAERYALTRLGDIGGFCQNTSSFEITINGLDNADFTYDSSTYCVGGTDPTPTFTGLTGGVFTSTASLSIDTASGTIDLSASSPGSYTVTYTTSGNCTNTSNFNITILPQDDGTFSYGSLLYCKGETNPTPTISEYTAGTFVSTAGLSFVSSSTGEIDLSASVSGTYTVSYTTGGTCTVTTSQIIQIAEKDDASFSFPRTNYTLNCYNPTPTITGLTGGVWEAPAGLTINPTTGEINLSASASGTYTVSYTVNNLCINTATTTIILSPADDPYFSYSKYSYCVNENDPTPLNIATVSGTFSGSASITVNATTGVIDISASSVGDHIITYTTSSTCPSTSSRTITITPLEDATFTFSSGSYCKGSSNVSPTITTPGGTFTSPANLYMNASSGLINIALSTPGT